MINSLYSLDWFSIRPNKANPFHWHISSTTISTEYPFYIESKVDKTLWDNHAISNRFNNFKRLLRAFVYLCFCLAGVKNSEMYWETFYLLPIPDIRLVEDWSSKNNGE